MASALYLAHLNPLTRAHEEIISELIEAADTVKVMPVVFRDGGREINSRSFPFDYETRRRMLRAVFGSSIDVTDDYLFEAPFRRYLPPLVRSRPWALRRRILRGVEGGYFTYTGDRAEYAMLLAYGLRPRLGRRKEVSATSVKERLFRAALGGDEQWRGDVPGPVAKIIDGSWGTVEEYAGTADQTNRVAGMKFPKEGWAEARGGA
ncbi:MAG: hypothetical protein MPI95_06740 [Nitrosopumilus sp.]|nr:hypothetical protein [Nitrosopumilus sp.]CAI9832348.1 conserved hypothetical protein [Nitrosopumilaceae archaeon]MDA7942025.1 hypothetical protein [Nitrosopumilus sp.]MDA7944074.1 hypothetical protein [Nitrosopumilus sp.]MDA7945578.1 hypothetical protein [Nitrosopumilus sp.]